MKIFNSILEYQSHKKSIVTIGTFDGVHIGHKIILKKIIDEAIKDDCESVLLTFFPHPRMILDENNSSIKLLNTLPEKIKLLEDLGLSVLIIHPFDKEFSQLSAQEFVSSILIDKLNLKKIIIGHDHRFGKNRAANYDDLVNYSKQFSFQVEQISAQEINKITVSSTKIRTAISNGNISLANKYLTYNYSLTGKVVKGRQLGRTIGYPTANIKVEENYKLIPMNGVYIVSSFYNKQQLFGMMNIGIRPTVNGKETTIEVHFFNFNSSIYNEMVSISILKKIRDEQRFESLKDLQAQLNQDKNYSLFYLSDL